MIGLETGIDHEVADAGSTDQATVHLDGTQASAPGQVAVGIGVGRQVEQGRAPAEDGEPGLGVEQ